MPIKTIVAFIGVQTFLILITTDRHVIIESKSTFIALFLVTISCLGILSSQFMATKKIKSALQFGKIDL